MQNGLSALMFAAQDGHTASVQVLVGAGADKDAKDKVRKNESFFMNESERG